jgi:hypothetical protein
VLLEKLDAVTVSSTELYNAAPASPDVQFKNLQLSTVTWEFASLLIEPPLTLAAVCVREREREQQHVCVQKITVNIIVMESHNNSASVLQPVDMLAEAVL